MTTPDRLREAARVLRERAEAATPGPWTVPLPDDEYVGPADVVSVGEPGSRYVICEHAGTDATYIATMHPGVALAVAEWLVDLSDEVHVEHPGGVPDDFYWPALWSALAVADAILGGGE